MTRPSLPIDINTKFQISIGDFSEVSEKETNYNPIELSRNELYDTFEPEIINGCCCTIQNNNIWRTCNDNLRTLIITDTPKVYVKYNDTYVYDSIKTRAFGQINTFAGNDFTNCYYLDKIPELLNSDLTHLEINILVIPDIFLTPPTSDTNKIVFSISMFFNTYITFDFVIETSNTTQTIFLDYLQPKWTLTTNSSTIHLPYTDYANGDLSHIVYTPPINTELNRINIFGGLGIVQQNNSLVTDIGPYVGIRTGSYDNNFMPIFEIIS